MSVDGTDAEPLRLSASQVSRGTVRLVVAGEVDLGTEDDLRRALTRLMGDRRVSRLVVDFADVSFLDAAGMAALLAGYRYAEGRGITFTVVNCRPKPLRLLEIVALDKLLTG
jgi:anti-anti-sigma factor